MSATQPVRLPAPDPGPARTVSQALAAVERLLASSVHAAGPSVVQEALTREARRFLPVDAALLLGLDADGRCYEVLASDPPPRGGHPTLRRDSAAAERLRSLGDGLPVRRLDGAAASALARAVGAGEAEAALLVTVGAPEDERSAVLALLAADAGAFPPEEVEIARAFARAAAASLAQLRAAEEQAGRVAQHAALVRAAKSLNETLDPAHVITQITREAAMIMEADNAAVYLGDAEHGVVLEAVHGSTAAAVGYHIEPGKGVAGKVSQHGQPMFTNHYAAMSGLPEDNPFAHVQACVGAPMSWGGRVQGVLTVGFHREGRATARGMRLLTGFAELAAVACRNASVHAGVAVAARTDQLTGCVNHATLQDALRREVERCERSGHRFSLILLDLDDFKQVNEEHGHLAGDAVLRRVGRIMRSAIRPYDLAARYGGDEFAIVAVDSGEAEAVDVARRLLQRLEHSPGAEIDGGRRATIGVAEWRPGMTGSDVVHEADLALLDGKHARGKGVVVPGSRRTIAEDAASAPAPPAATPAGRRAAPVPTAFYDQTERLRHRTRQLALANKLAARLAAMTDPRDICEAAVDELNRAFGFYLCAVIRLRSDGYVHAAAVRGDAFIELFVSEWSQPRDTGLIGRCLREKRVLLVNDIRSEPDFQVTDATGDVQAEVVAPIWVGDELWGAINCETTEAGAFDEDDASMLQTVADQVGSALRSALLFERLEGAYLGTAEALGAALEAKDSYTAQHARSIVELAAAVGERLGFGAEDLRDLRLGAALHDVGKIAIPEAILNKRGPLTPEERATMETHTIVGEQIIAPVEFLAGVRPLVRHEHERWDGQGYPDGLAGEEIPLGARIVLACDAYHAMTSDRPYRAAMVPEAARAELRANAGTQFDPRVVDAVLEVLGD